MKTQEGYEKQIGIWLRVSTANQAEGDSPEHHEKRARLYAEAKGWQVAEVYHLEGVRGTSVIAGRDRAVPRPSAIARGHCVFALPS